MTFTDLGLGTTEVKGRVSGDVEGMVISMSSCYRSAVISAAVRPVLKIYWCDQQYNFIIGLTTAEMVQLL